MEGLYQWKIYLIIINRGRRKRIATATRELGQQDVSEEKMQINHNNQESKKKQNQRRR